MPTNLHESYDMEPSRLQEKPKDKVEIAKKPSPKLVEAVTFGLSQLK